MKFWVVLFIILVVLQPVALILQKKGMQGVGPINSFGELFKVDALMKIATNPYIIGGSLLAVFLLILWLGLLSTTNISYIFPFGSLAQIVLALLALVFLKEHITGTHWAGIVVIMIGCYLINK